MRIPAWNRWKIASVLWLTLVVCAISPANGFGFFWPGWPGSKVTPTPPSPLPPLGPVPTTPGGPVTPEPPRIPQFARIPPNSTDPVEFPYEDPPLIIEPNAPVVPEPGTLLMGLLGLGTLGGVQYRRRQRQEASEELATV